MSQGGGGGSPPVAVRRVLTGGGGGSPPVAVKRVLTPLVAARRKPTDKEVADARTLLRGNTTDDALKNIEAEVAKWMDPVHVYICELASQFIYVTYARAYVISQVFNGQTSDLDPASVAYKQSCHAEAVYNKLKFLIYSAVDAETGQPLCSEGERVLFSRAQEEGWVGVSFVKLLAELRATVLSWKVTKVAAFLDAIFEFDYLLTHISGVNWTSIPILSTCFSQHRTDNKSLSFIWKWGACVSALVAGLLATGEYAYHDRTMQAVDALRGHLATIASLEKVMDIPDKLADELISTYVMAQNIWADIAQANVDRAIEDMGSLGLAAAVVKGKSKHAAAAGGAAERDQMMWEVLLDYSNELPTLTNTIQPPLLQTAVVQEAVYGTAEVVNGKDAGNRKDIDSGIKNKLKDKWEVKISTGNPEKARA